MQSHCRVLDERIASPLMGLVVKEWLCDCQVAHYPNMGRWRRPCRLQKRQFGVNRNTEHLSLDNVLFFLIVLDQIREHYLKLGCSVFPVDPNCRFCNLHGRLHLPMFRVVVTLAVAQPLFYQSPLRGWLCASSSTLQWDCIGRRGLCY